MARLDITDRYGTSIGFIGLLCAILIGIAIPAQASKGNAKKDDHQSELRMAAAPKEPAIKYSRVGRRRFHGTNSMSRSSLPRSARRNLARHNASRALVAEREQVLDPSRIRPIDGDTFTYGDERIRIQGYKAAERNDPAGPDATERLDQWLHHGRVTMISKGTDIYGRTIAEVFVDHHSVADLLAAGP